MKPDLAGMTPKQAVTAMIDKFDPAIAKTAREALAIMRRLLPGTFEIIADNYNALGIGFSSSESSSGVVMSIVLYPRWVSLFFFDGALLADPTKRLKGSGKVIRHIVLEKGAATLAEPDVHALIRRAIAAVGEGQSDRSICRGKATAAPPAKLNYCKPPHWASTCVASVTSSSAPCRDLLEHT